MLDQNKINQFTTKARAAGYTDAQIQAEIERKKKESQAAVQPTAPVAPATPSVSQPVSGGMDMQDTTFAQPQTPKPVERTKPTGFLGALDSATEFLFPRTKKFLRKVVSSAVMGKQLDTIEESNKQLQDQASMLAKRAIKETDPTKKALYLKQSKELSAMASKNIEDIIGGFESNTGTSINSKENVGSGKKIAGIPQEYLTEGLGVGGEVGSFFAPAAKATKAGLIPKIVAGAKTGATIGAIQGLTSPDVALDDVGGRLQKGLVDAGFGGLVGGAFTTAYEVPKEILKKSLNGAPNVIRGVFKIAPSEMRKFRKVNGMDFGEEILARDGKSISGMSYNEIADHMAEKKDAAQQVVADALKGAKGTIKTPDVVKAIDEKIASLAPEKGNVNTEGAISTLESIKATLEKNPQELTLEVANNLKRQLQEAGSSAFAPNGKPTPSSEAFAEVSQTLRNMIEEKAPGVKEGNKLIQLYHLANESILKQGDAAANRVASGNLQKFIQNIPAIGGAGLGFAVGGVPGGVAGIIGGEVISGLQGTIRNKFLSPEFQTRLAGAIEAGLQGIEKPTTQQIKAVTDRVVQEGIKQLTRSGTAGTTEPVDESQNQQLPGNNQTQEQQPIQHDSSINQGGMDINQTTFAKPDATKNEPKTATGYTVEQHLEALSKATAAGDTAAVKQIKAQLAIEQSFQKAGAGKGKAIPASQAVPLSDYDAAISVMDEVDSELKNNSNVFSPIKGRLSALNPYDTQAQTTQAIVNRAAQVVGKALEGGVLRKEDEEKYRKQLPQITDTLAVAKGKAEKIKQMLIKNRKQKVDALKKAGYNPEMIDFSNGTQDVSFDNPAEY